MSGLAALLNAMNRRKEAPSTPVEAPTKPQEPSDGGWGALVQQAIGLPNMGSTKPTTEDKAVPYPISDEFRKKVGTIAKNLETDPNHLLAVMNFETGGTFRSDITNAAGSGAVGLIQFMPSTVKGLDTTPEELAKMTPEEQLDVVENYFSRFKGKIKTVEDAYMAVLWPKAVGKPNDYVLFKEGTTAYKQNAGLDRGKKGYITKADAAGKVRSRIPDDEGKQNGN